MFIEIGQKDSPFSKGFNDHGNALTAADASGRDTVPSTTALQFMSEGENEASTCAANG